MNKEPNKNNEPNEEAKVLSDEELEGIVGGVSVKEMASAIPIKRGDKMRELAASEFETIAEGKLN